MKIIMYHYVQEFNKNFPYFSFLSIENFKKQLDYFQNSYYFPTYEEFLSYIKKEITLPDNSIILTFDDGFKSHYEYVLPELKRRNLWGIFYIPTGQYINNKMLNVHKIHLLIGRISPGLLYKHMQKYINKGNHEILVKENIDVLYENQHNDDKIKIIKKYLNYYIKLEYRNEIIDLLFKNFFENDEKKYIEQFYLSLSEIRTLKESGMIIGNHSIDHLVLSQLSYEQQLEQIEKSHVFLSKLINAPIDSFCYPYGGKHVYNEDTFKILEKLNLKFAVDVYFSDTISDNVNDNIYSIYRYDCNMFEYGSIYKHDSEINYKLEEKTDFIIKNIKKYESITVFTGNQPRHVSLVNKLKEICNSLYVIIECSTLFKERDGIMKTYFDQVKISEDKIFGKYKFLGDNVHVLPISYDDAGKLKPELLGKSIYSDVFIVYGSSWLRGNICEFLEKKNAINIHLGASPYYRGTATTFWPLYDKRIEYVGGTIHNLVNKLDAGKIYYTVLPKIINCRNIFDFTMMIAEITQNVLVEKLENYDIWRMDPIVQDSSKEIRSAKGRDFTEEVAEYFLNNIPTIKNIKKIQGEINYNKFINPIICHIDL